jgi:AhpD family alkylhydroperoxidase
MKILYDTLVQWIHRSICAIRVSSASDIEADTQRNPSRREHAMNHDEFDYIVVGAGSAGCTLASRLTEDPNVTVCLLEAGGRDTSVLIHAPAGFVAMVPTTINNYAYQTVPQPGLNGRCGYQPRGKTLGGSSAINAMFYVRGNRWDYDQWASLGNPGWSYDDVLPLFTRAENNEQFKDDFHGQGGLLNVTYSLYQSPLSKLFLEAAALHQIRLNPDYNGAEQEGAFEYQVTHKDGERCCAAKAYITPNLSRKNFRALTHAVTAKVQSNGLSQELINLVYLRVSQINGCAYCIDMHSRDLLRLDVLLEKLVLVPVWRDAVTMFSTREQIALAWAETVTRVANIPDADYAAAATEFDGKELTDLTYAISLMNVFNRLSIAFRTPRCFGQIWGCRTGSSSGHSLAFVS